MPQSLGGLLYAISSIWWRITRLARLAIVLLASGPILGAGLALFGERGLATAATLTPVLGGLLMLWIALRNPRNLAAIGAIVGILAVPQNRAQIFASFLSWIALYLALAATAGVYVYFVPISNNRPLVLPLVASIGALAFFALSGRRGKVVQWAKTVLTLFAIGITVAFYFSGGKEAKAQAKEQIESAEAAPRVEKYTLAAGEEKFTCRQVGPGTQHLIRANNKPWVALPRDDTNGTHKRSDGNYRPENYGAGEEVVWRGAAPAGPLLAMIGGETAHLFVSSG
ncbi:MAG: hypothetical protein HYS78_01065 [Parcubacteria group bacterium]|nr:hypothetical protein [Parcubacteria group bacterium]